MIKVLLLIFLDYLSSILEDILKITFLAKAAEETLYQALVSFHFVEGEDLLELRGRNVLALLMNEDILFLELSSVLCDLDARFIEELEENGALHLQKLQQVALDVAHKVIGLWTVAVK